MSVVTEEMLKAILRAYMARMASEMQSHANGEIDIPSRDQVEIILAAVAPLIAAQELERAAAMVETSLYIMSDSKPSHLEYDPKRAKNDNHHATIAAAIRALGEAT
jgi:hypothetical protein